MTIIDTNVLVSFYNSEDSNHDNAWRDISELTEENELFLIPQNIVAETYTVLLHKVGRNESLKFINKILKIDNVIVPLVDQKVFEVTLRMTKIIQKKLSFIDITLIVFAHIYSAQLLTYDQNLIDEYKKPLYHHY